MTLYVGLNKKYNQLPQAPVFRFSVIIYYIKLFQVRKHFRSPVFYFFDGIRSHAVVVREPGIGIVISYGSLLKMNTFVTCIIDFLPVWQWT